MDPTMILSILLTLLAIILLSLIIYARWNFGKLEALEIPVVPRHFILGSTHNAHKEVTYEEDIQRLKEYGPVWGVYEGREAQVHICDLEIIKDILVKDFDHFQARRANDFGSPILNEMSGFIQAAEKWKMVRQLTSPGLSPLKIKEMSPAMKETLTDFTADIKNKLEQNGNQPLKVDVNYLMFTMVTDMVLRCIFKIKVPNPSDPKNYFVDLIKRLMLREVVRPPPNIFYSMGLSFPFLKKFQKPLSGTAADDFARTFKEILSERRKCERNQKDFTETVLGWMDRLDTPEFQKVNITEDTLIMQAFLMFFAGVDQISYFLSLLFFHVGQNPEVEVKLRAELDAFRVKHSGEVKREDLHELPYLSACVNESLRMGSIFMRLERVCTKDWTRGTLRIKKGMVAMIPIWATHRDPEIFPDPEKFDPERFMVGNKEEVKAASHLMTFGHGPKSCIAMRFSIEAMLLTAAHVCHGLSFRWNSDTQLAVKPGNLFVGFPEPIFMDVVGREDSN